jgi:serine/threonine protein kinase/tetratricopeptide (TPR) repeat protein
MSENERAEIVERVFHEALAFDAASRADFLATACAGDVAVMADVASLLIAYESDDLLERPAFHVSAAELAGGLIDEGLSKARFEDYALLREIGRGGMGAVYEALRRDTDSHERLAVKLVQPEMATEFIIRRFEHERLILARLEHPYIARLLDGGTTTDGLPYLVMEYVEGQPIDQFVAYGGLAIAERLEVFLNVCEAVSYAHQQSVIHRDLKPSNILVTPDGTPKLLDFGIAKLMDTDVDGKPGDNTTTIHRVMTPRYASPEQLSGRAPTEVSDVYSLGVLLYVLLTGEHPYQFSDQAPEAILRSMESQPSRRPSDVITKRELKGDLDRIVMKALRRESGRRYKSVAHLANDIRLHLAGQKITARGDSVAYRSQRFVRQHRAYLVPTAVIGALCLLFGVLLGFSGAQNQPGSSIAVVSSSAETATSKRLAEPPVHEQTITVVTQLGEIPNATQWSQSLLRQTSDEEAHRLYVLGRYFFNRRHTEDFFKAIEYFHRATEKDPRYALAYAGLADCYGLLGAYFKLSPDEAFNAARAAAKKALEADESLAEAHNSLALVHWLYDWDWAAADREFRRAIELRSNFVTAHHWRGLFLGEMGRFAEAEAEMKLALALDSFSSPVIADYGRVLFWARRYHEAAERYRTVDEMGNDFGSWQIEAKYCYEQIGRSAEWGDLHERFGGGFDPEERKAFREHGLRGYWMVQYRRQLPQTGGGTDAAEVAARVGDKENAFRYLAEAIRIRDHRMSQLKVNPIFDPLRSDPRFVELLRRMNLAA